MSKSKNIDLTEGSIAKQMIAFAIPLFLGNLFQQMYNMVDTWVVGRFVSNEAYAAVGSVGPIINMLIGFFSGFASGAGVVISQYYGAKMLHKVRETVHTALMLTLVMGILLTAVGLLMIPTALRLIKMPAEAVADATTYLRIIFSGIMGLMFYNMGAGILRAVGDSKRPFYYLVVCAVMNTVLDLLFVIVFSMGTAGVALATILSQGTSAILVIITLMRSDSCIRLSLRRLKIVCRSNGRNCACTRKCWCRS